jgi:hypothetical protein
VNEDGDLLLKDHCRRKLLRNRSKVLLCFGRINAIQPARDVTSRRLISITDIIHIIAMDAILPIVHTTVGIHIFPMIGGIAMPDIILRLTPETLARIDMLKARIELQESRNLHRSTVLLRGYSTRAARLWRWR